jgi:hypothetical protein
VSEQILIGLTGLKGSGKDTFALFLAEHGFERYAFADPMKLSAAAALGTTVAILEEHKNNPAARVALFDGAGQRFGNPPLASITVREYLQRYGTEAHREVFGDRFWIDPVIEAACQNPRAVITDARFANEQSAIREVGGTIIRIDRPGTDEGDGHASENVEHGLTDMVVPNHGTLRDLEMAARNVIRMIRTNRMQSE